MPEKKEETLDQLIAQLQDLQIEQADITERIQAIHRYEQIPAADLARRFSEQVPVTDTTIRVGDRVRITSPGRFQSTSGTVRHITDKKRVIIVLPSGQTTWRAPHNVIKIRSDGKPSPS